MRLNFCVACGVSDGLENHHLLPKSEGGSDEDTNLITLCYQCHGKVHGIVRRDIGSLVKLGIERSKAKGVVWGATGRHNLTKCPIKLAEIRKKGTKALQQKSDEFAILHYPEISRMRKEGKSLDAIASSFNERGITTLRGSPNWTRAQVLRYINRMVEINKKREPEGSLS